MADQAMARNTLQQIADLLEKHNACPNTLAAALSGDDTAVWDYLESNHLWGGPGSIADEALIDTPARGELDRLMIRLGREQMRLGKVNDRTSMWVEAFEKWQAEGIR